ncbi:hypothetical protein AA313_de0205704 [Arthrobotrys entomopaga]|nr:hypothetical protein AA313_de0205704 [Arthrobotrys entomopaga]
MAIWGDVLITLPWTLYQAYNDVSVLRETWNSMVDYHTNGIPRIPEGQEHAGMWKPAGPNEMYQFGDWLNPSSPPEDPQLNATDPYFVADTWLCHTTITMFKAATALQLPDSEIREWSLKASSQVSLWQKRYLLPLTPATNVANGASQLIQEDVQTAYALALNFHLLPEEYIQSAVARLHHLVRKENYHPTTGLAGTAELLHAVTYPHTISNAPSKLQINSLNLAYKLLLGRRDIPSWLYPITKGATSMWERWDSVKPDGTTNAAWMTSLNHYALGAPGRWIFENIGGIRMDYDDGSSRTGKRGWSKFVFDPVPNIEHGVTAAEMIYHSPKGLVECKWNYNKGTKMVEIEVAVPGNCEGEIRVLGKTMKNVGAGRWSVESKVHEWQILEAGEGEQQSRAKL